MFGLFACRKFRSVLNANVCWLAFVTGFLWWIEFATAQPAQAGEVLRIQGSTTFASEILTPALSGIEKATGRRLAVIANKSSWGLLALLEGRADVAMISAALPAEVKSANKLKPELSFDGLQAFPIATTRIAFAVHHTNPVRILSFDTMARVLNGELTNWLDVGGPDLAIRVVAVNEGGGTVAAVREQMLGEAPFAPGAIRLENAKHVVKVVSQEPGAIGITQLSLTQQAGMSEITLERSVEQPLSFVTVGPPSPEMLAFMSAVRSVSGHDGK